LAIIINKWLLAFNIKGSYSLYSTMLNNATCFGLYSLLQA